MSKIVMFMRNEMFFGEKERNEQFRKKVNKIAKLMLDEEFTYSEYNVNTPSEYSLIFNENKDCQLVFTTENNTEAQYQACIRGIPVLEWNCFTDDKFYLVNVNKSIEQEIPMYKGYRSR